MLINEPDSCDLFYIQKRPGQLNWIQSPKRRGVSYKTLVDVFQLRTAVLIAQRSYAFDLDWLWVSFRRFSGTPLVTDERLVKAWAGSVMDCSFSLCTTEDWSSERQKGVGEWIWTTVTDYTIQGR